jgi:hypothetical protein
MTRQPTDRFPEALLTFVAGLFLGALANTAMRPPAKMQPIPLNIRLNAPPMPAPVVNVNLPPSYQEYLLTQRPGSLPGFRQARSEKP